MLLLPACFLSFCPLPVAVLCSYCGKKFLPNKLPVHLRFFCGPDAHKSEALAKQQKKRKGAGQQQQAAAAEDEDEEEAEAVTTEEPDQEAEDQGGCLGVVVLCASLLVNRWAEAVTTEEPEQEAEEQGACWGVVSKVDVCLLSNEWLGVCSSLPL
jgi:hypothetical protein